MASSRYFRPSLIALGLITVAAATISVTPARLLQICQILSCSPTSTNPFCTLFQCQLTQAQYPLIEDILSNRANNTRFLIDSADFTAHVSRVEPYIGTGPSNNCNGDHAGAHLHFNKPALGAGTASIPGIPTLRGHLIPVYAPFDGVVEVTDCFLLSSASGRARHDKYQLNIIFAEDNTQRPFSFSISMEPFAGINCAHIANPQLQPQHSLAGSSTQGINIYSKLILVNHGDAVSQGQQIANLWIPENSRATPDDSTHIHFDISGDGVNSSSGFACPNVFDDTTDTLLTSQCSTPNFCSSSTSVCSSPINPLCRGANNEEDLFTQFNIAR